MPSNFPFSSPGPELNSRGSYLLFWRSFNSWRRNFIYLYSAAILQNDVILNSRIDKLKCRITSFRIPSSRWLVSLLWLSHYFSLYIESGLMSSGVLGRAGVVASRLSHLKSFG